MSSKKTKNNSRRVRKPYSGVQKPKPRLWFPLHTDYGFSFDLKARIKRLFIPNIDAKSKKTLNLRSKDSGEWVRGSLRIHCTSRQSRPSSESILATHSSHWDQPVERSRQWFLEVISSSKTTICLYCRTRNSKE